MLDSEERLRALDRKRLEPVDDLLALVVAPSGIPLQYLFVNTLPIASSTARET
jgi:hypothetical protein